MIDTNQIQTALETANNTVHIVRTQMSPWLPAIAIAAAWFGRELTRFSAWLQTAAAKIITHGGLLKILWKLLWN
jgi:hypothetical protein